MTAQTPTDAKMTNPAKLPHAAASQICGQCHSSSQPKDRFDWLANGSRYFPGDDHTKSFVHATFGDTNPRSAGYLKDSYWNDGTCRVGGDELLGMQVSKCYLDGQMSCLTCHSMHDSDPTDQLKVFGDANGSCLQCHSDYEDQIEQHSHHSVTSGGSQCVNCHMPHTSFALFKAIRSHRIDSPSPAASIAGRPNACNLCHLDKSLAWTADHLADWYGHKRPPLSNEEKTRAASVLWVLRGDAIQRAITAWHLAWQPALAASGSDWQTPFLAQALTDPYSVVRFIGWRSMLTINKAFAEVEYDFLQPAAHWTQARDAAIELWNAREGRATKASVLLFRNADGQMDLEAVRAVIKERDNRPVDILE